VSTFNPTESWWGFYFPTLTAPPVALPGRGRSWARGDRDRRRAGLTHIGSSAVSPAPSGEPETALLSSSPESGSDRYARRGRQDALEPGTAQ